MDGIFLNDTGGETGIFTKGNCEHYSKRLTSVSSIKLDASSINAVRDAAVRKCERSVRS